uniref:Uncharacterized protein n=1 Tax=Emiliania huxleyi TaxID=2903 RepID=A0A7S3VZF0_EMIHU
MLPSGRLQAFEPCALSACPPGQNTGGCTPADLLKVAALLLSHLTARGIAYRRRRRLDVTVTKLAGAADALLSEVRHHDEGGDGPQPDEPRQVDVSGPADR